MAQPIFPPPDALAGYLEFISRVILTARVMGWQNAPHDQIADLMDALHNLPSFLPRWHSFDQELFREYLKIYDEKWPEGVSLLTCLEDCLRQPCAEP
jgi:hypothetical protein